MFQIADEKFADPLLLFGYYAPSIVTIFYRHRLLVANHGKQGSPDPVRFCYSDAVVHEDVEKKLINLFTGTMPLIDSDTNRKKDKIRLCQ